MASLYGFAIKCAVPTVLGGVVNRADHGRGALAFSVRGSVPAWVTVGLRLWFPEQSNLPWSLPCLLLLPAPCEPRAWLDEQPRLCPKRELRSLARAPRLARKPLSVWREKGKPAFLSARSRADFLPHSQEMCVPVSSGLCPGSESFASKLWQMSSAPGSGSSPSWGGGHGTLLRTVTHRGGSSQAPLSVPSLALSHRQCLLYSCSGYPATK